MLPHYNVTFFFLGPENSITRQHQPHLKNLSDLCSILISLLEKQCVCRLLNHHMCTIQMVLGKLWYNLTKVLHHFYYFGFCSDFHYNKVVLWLKKMLIKYYMTIHMSCDFMVLQMTWMFSCSHYNFRKLETRFSSVLLKPVVQVRVILLLLFFLSHLNCFICSFCHI